MSGDQTAPDVTTVEDRQQTDMTGDNGDWAASQVFLHRGPSATLEFLKPDVRAQLYAYQAQARDGSFPEDQDLAIISDHTFRRKQEAWRALVGMDKEVAKQKLVALLDEVLPEWREWYAQYSSVVGDVQKSGEADRLLRAFAERNRLSKL